MDTVVNALNWLATNIPWKEIFESGVLTGVLTALLVPVYRIVKRVYDHYKEVMIVVVGLFGVGASFAAEWISANPKAPGAAFVTGLAIAFGTQPMYKVAKLFGAYLTRIWLANWNKAKELHEASSAKVPAEGLPVHSE